MAKQYIHIPKDKLQYLVTKMVNRIPVISEGTTTPTVSQLKEGEIYLELFDEDATIPTITTLADSDKILLNSGDVGKAILASDMATYMRGAILNGGISHNSIFRGKNLGTSYTTAQQTAVANGTFDDMYVGDYWVINGVTWRIVDLGLPFYNCGDTNFTKFHVVVMPDANILGGDGKSAWMNDTDTTSGGYVGTKYRSTHRATCKTIIANAFGSAHIATHRELMCNAVNSSGQASGWAWTDADVELPTEANIYGSSFWGLASMGGGTGYNGGVNKSQFALFRLAPRFMNTRYNYWLRDVVSSSNFAFVATSGFATTGLASYPWVGFRPYFCLI